MKLKPVLLGLTAAALSTGVAFAQMQPIPNPPEKPQAAGAKHHATKHKAAHHKKATKTAATSSGTSSAAPASGGAK